MSRGTGDRIVRVGEDTKVYLTYVVFYALTLIRGESIHLRFNRVPIGYQLDTNFDMTVTNERFLCV